jgi:BirA family transcriptional regulator, biotin operon repressor / biotin---[acetyl-CoA-carboxylase] ligase
MKTHPSGNIAAAWAAALQSRLQVEIIGRSLCAFAQTSSTSDTAREMATGGAPDGQVVVARAQNRGRGRRGRDWLSLPGQGAYLSAVLRPAMRADDAGWLAILGGVAAVCALEDLGLKGLKLKWPNDVLAAGRKIAGVLVEPRLSGATIEFSVLGIGVNVGQGVDDWPGNLKETATSCRIEGSSASCDDVIVAVLGQLDRWYRVVKASQFEQLMEAWVQRGGTSRVPVIA